MNEKRKHPRFINKQKIWCEGQEETIQVESRDMSQGGMSIVSKKGAPQVGSKVKVSFVVPEGGNVSVNMEVVWSGKKAGNSDQVMSGLRVVNFEKGQEAFDKFVDNHLKDDKKEEEKGKKKTTDQGSDSSDIPPTDP